MLTDNRVFIKVRVFLIICTSIGIHKKPTPRYQQISTAWYSLTVGTSSTHQWVRVIPGQIIMGKQLCICTPLKFDICFSCLQLTLCTREFTGRSKAVLLLQIFNFSFRPMETITESCFFIKVTVILMYCLKMYKYWRSQKRAYHLSTHLYDQVYI